MTRDFYACPTVDVARALLGVHLVFERPDGVRVGRIVETEAYVGTEDLASHASRGRTARTAPMFGPPGHAYIYLIYGMYHCLNVVTEQDGVAGAVLIRAAEILEGPPGSASGPGRLGRWLGLDRELSGRDMTVPPLYLSSGDRLPDASVLSGPRVGVDYAGLWAERPWRFWVEESPAVSGPPTRARNQRRRSV
ncbi:MAG: DNA-3-methyladenine glycosylase [Chloroflexi bacterium]|nr:DNA-3-methyladenine glycosylase [Chloroflexota bacterium]